MAFTTSCWARASLEAAAERRMPFYSTSQPPADRFRKHVLGVKLSNITLAIVPSADVLMKLPCWRIPTTLFLTTRCSRSACISVFASAKFPAPPNILKRLPHQLPPKREIWIRRAGDHGAVCPATVGLRSFGFLAKAAAVLSVSIINTASPTAQGVMAPAPPENPAYASRRPPSAHAHCDARVGYHPAGG